MSFTPYFAGLVLERELSGAFQLAAFSGDPTQGGTEVFERQAVTFAHGTSVNDVEFEETRSPVTVTHWGLIDAEGRLLVTAQTTRRMQLGAREQLRFTGGSLSVRFE